MGIGRACAKRFAKEGAKLIVADVAQSEGQAVAEEINDAGGKAKFIEADVAERSDNKRIVEACLETYGQLDILFCNAGITLPKTITESDDEEIDRVIDINLKGLMYASQSAIPHMLKQGGGNILFNASKTGLVAQENSPVYCASKGGSVMLAKALALDYATENIRVNALCPGIIDTPMLKKFSDDMPEPEVAWEEFQEAQPIGRLGTPEECADAALWLVSDEASFITGVALPVDGGFTAK